MTKDLRHISDHNTTAKKDVPHKVHAAAKEISAKGSKSLEASKYLSDAHAGKKKH